MKIANILKKIVETKKREIKLAYKNQREIITQATNSSHKVLSLRNALAKKQLTVIAELKKGSPSAGIIEPNFSPVDIAKSYQENGADAISCLTDEKYFYGCGSYLQQIRPHINIPILRKDFIIDPIQIYEAKAWGADAFLLIASILDENNLQKLYKFGRKIGLEVLIEVHNKEELARTLDIGVDIIGVNNRNLHNFSVNLDLLKTLAPLIPDDVLVVGESGIKSLEDAKYLQSLGADSLLIGESLVNSKNSLSLKSLKDND